MQAKVYALYAPPLHDPTPSPPLGFLGSPHQGNQSPGGGGPILHPLMHQWMTFQENHHLLMLVHSPKVGK
jgi:hypothetical protein